MPIFISDDSKKRYEDYLEYAKEFAIDGKKSLEIKEEKEKIKSYLDAFNNIMKNRNLSLLDKHKNCRNYINLLRVSVYKISVIYDKVMKLYLNVLEHHEDYSRKDMMMLERIELEIENNYLLDKNASDKYLDKCIKELNNLRHKVRG